MDLVALVMGEKLYMCTWCGHGLSSKHEPHRCSTGTADARITSNFQEFARRANAGEYDQQRRAWANRMTAIVVGAAIVGSAIVFVSIALSWLS